MAKQNRRINLAKREVKQLREQLKAERTSGKANVDRIYSQLKMSEAREYSLRNELRDVVQRVRAICEHSWAVAPKALDANIRRMAAPPSHSQLFGAHDDYSRSSTDRAIIELNHLLTHAEHDQARFATYVHARLVCFAQGKKVTAGYAISDQVLGMVRDNKHARTRAAEMAAREIADRIFDAIAT
jgi:hypothetical protein